MSEKEHEERQRVNEDAKEEKQYETDTGEERGLDTREAHPEENPQSHEKNGQERNEEEGEPQTQSSPETQAGTTKGGYPQRRTPEKTEPEVPLHDERSPEKVRRDPCR